MTSQIGVNLGPAGNHGHELCYYTLFYSHYKDDSNKESIIFIAYSIPEIFKFSYRDIYVRVNLHKNWVQWLENLVTYIILGPRIPKLVKNVKFSHPKRSYGTWENGGS